MKIRSVELRRLSMRLREPFVTSFGQEQDKDVLLLKVDVDGVWGYGECAALKTPFYLEETSETAILVLRRWLIPLVLGREFSHPDEISVAFGHIRGNTMAKAALETAIWDAYAKVEGISLARALGGNKDEIGVGISVGIEAKTVDLLRKVEFYLHQGYQRVKVKIKPGWDVAIIRAIREEFGDIALMADANSAYRMADADLLRQLDDFDLMMIEQPLAHDDMIDHARLQKRLKTPICLDESIRSAEDGRKAIEIGSCKVINIKIGRVGGLTEARRLAAICAEHQISAWCGGMLEAGVGRLANIALTAHSGFNLPGDTGPSARYFLEDIIEPPVVFLRGGVLAVPNGPGIGSELHMERIERLTVSSERFVND